MASIKKRGHSWLVTVSSGYNSEGKKITKSKTFRTPEDMSQKKWQKELNRLALEFEQEVEKGLYLNSDINLKDFSNKWFQEYANNQLESKTLVSYKNELNSKILPVLGHLKLAKLTPVNILSFLNTLMEDGIRKDGKPGGYSDRTIKYQLQILSSILQQAVYWQIIPENPCKRVKVPKNKKVYNHEYNHSKTKFYTEEQTLTLLQLVKSQPLKYQVATNIAIFCGLRNGELLGLTWNNIDFENKTISINSARSYISGEGMSTKLPKTNSSQRVLNIPDILIKLLKKYKLFQNGEKVNCGSLWNKEWDDTPWLLTTWNGNGMHYNTLTNWLIKLIKRHNESIEKDTFIPKDRKSNYLLPIVSFHKLRHTSATLLIGQNTDIKTVSARLGHAQTSTTMNIYVHGLNSSDIKAANALENLLATDNKDIRPAMKVK